MLCLPFSAGPHPSKPVLCAAGVGPQRKIEKAPNRWLCNFFNFKLFIFFKNQNSINLFDYLFFLKNDNFLTLKIFL